MKISAQQKRQLRGDGHTLKPVLSIGEAGLTDGVFAEFDSTIAHHELIKVRIRAGDRSARDDIIRQLCDRGSATLIQRIGNVALVYRPNPDKKLKSQTKRAEGQLQTGAKRK